MKPDPDRHTWLDKKCLKWAEKEPWWMTIVRPVAIFLFCSLHFLTCLYCMIRYRTNERRYECYEYYAPWGWGRQPYRPIYPQVLREAIHTFTKVIQEASGPEDPNLQIAIENLKDSHPDFKKAAQGLIRLRWERV
jgi:hypothetical protein